MSMAWILLILHLFFSASFSTPSHLFMKGKTNVQTGSGLQFAVLLDACSKFLANTTFFIKPICNSTHVINPIYADSNCSSIVRTEEFFIGEFRNSLFYYCVDALPSQNPAGEWYSGNQSCNSTSPDAIQFYPDSACFSMGDGTSGIVSCSDGNVTVKNYSTTINCTGSYVTQIQNRTSGTCEKQGNGYWKFTCPTFDSGKNWIEKTLFAEDSCSTKGMIWNLPVGDCVAGFSRKGRYSRYQCFGSAVFVSTYYDDKCLKLFNSELVGDGNCSERIKVECKSVEPNYNLTMASIGYFSDEQCGISRMKVFRATNMCLPSPYANVSSRIRFDCAYSSDASFFVFSIFENSTSCPSNGSVVVKNSEDCLRNNHSQRITNFIKPECPPPSSTPSSSNVYVALSTFDSDTCSTSLGTFFMKTSTCTRSMLVEKTKNEWIKWHCTDKGAVLMKWSNSGCTGKSIGGGGVLYANDTCGIPGKRMKITCTDTVKSSSVGVYVRSHLSCSSSTYKVADYLASLDTCIEGKNFFNWDGESPKVSVGNISVKVSCFYTSKAAYPGVKYFSDSSCGSSTERWKIMKNGQCDTIDTKNVPSLMNNVRLLFNCPTRTLPAKKAYIRAANYKAGTKCAGNVTMYSQFPSNKCEYNLDTSEYVKGECSSKGVLLRQYSAYDRYCSSPKKTTLFEFNKCYSTENMIASCSDEEVITGTYKFTKYSKTCSYSTKIANDYLVVKDSCTNDVFGGSAKANCHYTATSSIFLVDVYSSKTSKCTEAPSVRLSLFSGRCTDTPAGTMKGTCPTPTSSSRPKTYHYAYTGMFNRDGECSDKSKAPDVALGFPVETCHQRYLSSSYYAKVYCTGGRGDALEIVYSDSSCATPITSIVWKAGVCDRGKFSHGCVTASYVYDSMILVSIYSTSSKCSSGGVASKAVTYKPGHCFHASGTEYLMAICYGGKFLNAFWSGKGGCNGTPTKIEKKDVGTCVYANGKYVKILCKEGTFQGEATDSYDGNAGAWWKNDSPTPDPDPVPSGDGNVNFTIYDKPCYYTSKKATKKMLVKDKCTNKWIDGSGSALVKCKYTAETTIFHLHTYSSSLSTCQETPTTRMSIFLESGECTNYGYASSSSSVKAFKGDCPAARLSSLRPKKYDFAYRGHYIGRCTQTAPDVAHGYPVETCVPGTLPYGTETAQYYSKYYCTGEQFDLVEMRFSDRSCTKYIGGKTWKYGECESYKNVAGCITSSFSYDGLIFLSIYKNEVCTTSKKIDGDAGVKAYKAGHCFPEGNGIYGMAICYKGKFLKARWSSKAGCNGTPTNIYKYDIGMCLTSYGSTFKVLCSEGISTEEMTDLNDGNAGKWWEKVLGGDSDEVAESSFILVPSVVVLLFFISLL